MTAIYHLSQSLFWYLLCLSSLALVLGALLCLAQAVRYRRGRPRTALAAGNLLLVFCVFVVLLDCAHAFHMQASDLARLKPFQWRLFALPWAAYALAEALCAAVLIWQLCENGRYRRTHLTPDAIRQTLDLLPEGFSISAQDGTVLLCNLRMSTLCKALTGRGLSDAERFWQCVTEAGKEQNGQYLVRLPSGEVWQFARDRLTAEDGVYDRIRATDVTERYRIVEDLAQKHAQLQDLQRRMKAVQEQSGDMFVAQEEANARAALHNQLGQVLLMGKHLIEHPENTDAGVVYLTTKQMNDFLLGEAEPPAQAEDPLQEAVAAAKSIGVTVEFVPPHPEPATDAAGAGSREKTALLADAIRECAANTVKHAGGDRLFVELAEAGNRAVLTNNGAPPKQHVAESGGLLALRRDVEAAGGTMQVRSSPAFSLTICFR